MLDRTGEDWIIAVINLRDEDFEAYWDDSGTDSKSPVAIAACYVATKKQWDELVREWNEVKLDEGFDFFHMTDFMLHRNCGIKPYCDWDTVKKRRVYRRLTSIMSIRIRHGFAMTVGKKDYDDLVPQDLKTYYGKDHYAWAVKTVMGQIFRWRDHFKITHPMQYVFSEVPKGKGTRGEIMEIQDSVRDDPEFSKKYGLMQDGLGFQNMRLIPPLQTVDILAWNMLDHYLNVISAGLDDVLACSPWFRPLRVDRPGTLAYLKWEQLQKWIDAVYEFRKTTGHFPSPRIERLREKTEKMKMKSRKSLV